MKTSIDNLDDIAYDGDGDTSEEEAVSAPESRRSLAELLRGTPALYFLEASDMYAFRDQESPPSRKDAAVTALLQIGLAAVRAAHGIHHSPDTETRARMKEGMREVVAVVDEGVKLDDRMKREDDAHRRRLAKTPMSLDQTAPALVTQTELLSPMRRPGTPTSLTSSIPPSKRSRLTAMTPSSSSSSSLPVFRTPGFGLPPAEAAAARARDPWAIRITSPNKNIPSSITTSRYPPKSRK